MLVIGGGPVGLAVALWARQLGAREVVVSDPVDARRALAEKVGASTTVDPTKQDVGDVFEQATGSRPGVVLECVGVPGMIQHAADVADIDATVVIAGVLHDSGLAAADHPHDQRARRALLVLLPGA